MGILFVVRWINWYARHTRPLVGRLTASDIGGINLKSLLNFCMLAMHTGVLFFFPILTLICWYFFVFFKLQKTPSIFLPPMESIYAKVSLFLYFLLLLSLLLLLFNFSILRVQVIIILHAVYIFWVSFK